MSGATDAEWTRFRAARPGDEDAARKMLAAHLAWRRQHLPLPAEAKRLGAGLPDCVSMLGDRRCRDGTRAVLIQCAMLDSDAGSSEEYALALAHFAEDELAHDSAEKVTVLLDTRAARGWPNPPAWTLLPLMHTVSCTLASNYPERLQRVVVSPVPWVATTVWTAASAILDEGIVEKVCLRSDHAGIEEFIDADAVAVCEAIRAGLARRQ